MSRERAPKRAGPLNQWASWGLTGPWLKHYYFELYHQTTHNSFLVPHHAPPIPSFSTNNGHIPCSLAVFWVHQMLKEKYTIIQLFLKEQIDLNLIQLTLVSQEKGAECSSCQVRSWNKNSRINLKSKPRHIPCKHPPRTMREPKLRNNPNCWL